MNILQFHARRGEYFTIPLWGVNTLAVRGMIRKDHREASPTRNLSSFSDEDDYHTLMLTKEEMDAGFVFVEVMLNTDLYRVYIQTDLLTALPKGKPPNWEDIASESDVKRIGKKVEDPRAGR